MRVSPLLTSLVLIVGLSSFGCEAGKGAESPLPTEGSSDSFYSPTEHGALAFGVPSNAAFADGQRFHAWTFTLAAKAAVQLEVQPGADNLDTVMYLYRRAAGATSWGQYVARNDDAGANPWSALSASLQAGEYRVLLKGYKTSVRGAFALLGQCTGGGCPSAECPATRAELPAQTGFGASCVADLEAVLLAGAASSAAVTVDERGRCQQDETARLAFDYYLAYFGRDELADLAEDPENVAIEVAVTRFGDRGWLADVTAGGDEDGLTLVFDARRTLLAYYQHNQSPDVGWFCLDAGEPAVDVEDLDLSCVGHYLHNLRAPEGQAAISSGSVRVDATTWQLPLLQAAVAQYAADQELAAAALVGYQASSWNDGQLLRARLSADGAPATEYLVGTDGYSTYVYTAAAGDATQLLCADASR